MGPSIHNWPLILLLILTVLFPSFVQSQESNHSNNNNSNNDHSSPPDTCRPLQQTDDTNITLLPHEHNFEIQQERISTPPPATAPLVLLSEIQPIFNPTRCEPYRGRYCSQFFRSGFHVGMTDTVSQEQLEFEIWRRRIRFLTASHPLQCGVRILANLCSRAFLPCRNIETVDPQTSQMVQTPVPIPYCKELCDNLRCPTVASMLVDNRICHDPTSLSNVIPVQPGYSCDGTLNWSRISGLNVTQTLQMLLPPCPAPLVNVYPGHPLAFNGAYCAAPCPNALYSKEDYAKQDIATTVLNLVSVLCLLILITSWTVFPRLRLKASVYFYLACICIITFSLTILVVMSWVKNKGLSETLCQSKVNEYHGSGYPLVQGLVCIFFFVAAVCWSFTCAIDVCLIVVFGMNITPKHHMFSAVQVIYHVLAWGLATYSIIGPLVYSQIGGTAIGSTFAWVSPSRQRYITQQNFQLSTNDGSLGESFDYRTIYDAGDTFVYYPLWIMTGASVILICFSLFRLGQYHWSHQKQYNIVKRESERRQLLYQSCQIDQASGQRARNDVDLDEPSTSRNSYSDSGEAFAGNNSHLIPPPLYRAGALSLETFIRLIIFITFNIFISVVFAIHKLFVVDYRGTLDLDETQFFVCLLGTYAVLDDYTRYNEICARTHNSNPATSVLLSFLLNSMGLIAFLTYATTPKLWRAWAGFFYHRCGWKCFSQYSIDYLIVRAPPIKDLPESGPGKTRVLQDDADNHEEENSDDGHDDDDESCHGHAKSTRRCPLYCPLWANHHSKKRPSNPLPLKLIIGPANPHRPIRTTSDGKEHLHQRPQ